MPTASDEIRATDRTKVIILGGGPNRIGQGIEFDYCCCHAAFAARELGFESVMINSNPETVSTDYDTSDLLFFEPLTLEDVLNVVERLGGTPESHGHAATRAAALHGIIVQFGGQTPLNLAHGLVQAGAPIIGTSVDSIDLAEDRKRFDALLERLGLRRPASGIAHSLDEAVAVAKAIGYPVLIRPSYVLGGRGMEICSDERALRSFITTALETSGADDAPVLIDKFLDGATEVDVDVVADFEPGTGGAPADGSRQALVCGVLEQIEQAGIHSGDSACVIPPASLPAEIVERIRSLARLLARELRVCGLMNIQLAVKDDEIYVLEVNPRASRTVPFVSKTTHVPWPAIAAKGMMGRTLAAQGAREAEPSGCTAIKESVFPFGKFPGVDVVLGPEMRSTGEVMGLDPSLAVAFAKAQISAGNGLPTSGGVFLSVREQDRAAIVEVGRELARMGFDLYTTQGTGEALRASGVGSTVLQKIGAGARPNVIDLMANRKIALIINTPTRTGWKTDEGRIRATAIRYDIPMITTATAAHAAVRAIAALQSGEWGVAALQDYVAPERRRAEPTVSASSRGMAARHAIVLVAAVALVTFLGAWATSRANMMPKRFGVVKEGAIYRSGEPTPGALRRAVERHTIKTIIDLGAFEPGSPEEARMQATAAVLGATRYRFDLEGDASGNPNYYVQALRLMTDPANQPVLVHCGAGTQRTGCAVMLYRHAVEGVDFETGLAEAREYAHDPGENPRLLLMLAEYGAEIERAFREGGWVPGVPEVPEAVPVEPEAP